MSTITTEHVRRLWAGICLISFLAIAGSVAVLLVLSYRWAEDEMIRALDHQSIVVGHSIRRPLERAIGLGIPLTEIPGVGDYLRRRLEATPTIGFVAVTDSAGNPLYQQGVSRPLLDRVLDDPKLRHNITEANQRAGLAGGRPVRIDDASISVMPLTVAGDIPGFVLIGVQRSQASHRLFENLRIFAIAGVIVTIVAMELLVFAMGAFCAAPASRLRRLIAGAQAGRFDALSARRGGDEFGLGLLAFNAVIRRVHDGFQRFCAHADEVQDAVFDRTVAGRVSAIRDTVVRDLGATLTEPPIRRSDGHAVDMHLPVFLAFASTSIMVAPLAVEQVVVTLIFLIALAIGFLRPPIAFEQRLPLRWRVAAGVLLVAVGAIVSIAPFDQAMLAAVVISGFGAGNATRAAAAYARAIDSGGDRRQAWLRRVAIRCLSGSVVGTLTGGFLITGWPFVIAIIAAVTALVGAFCAIRLMVKMPTSEAAA